MTDSLGNPILDPDYDDIEFWEAWEVTEGGDIWIGAAHEKKNGIKCSTDADCDSYTSFDYGKGTKGTWKVIGRVKFLEDYKIEPYRDGWKPGIRYKSLNMFGPLLFSMTQPAGWSDAGALEHNLTVEWDWIRQPYDIRYKAYP